MHKRYIVYVAVDDRRVYTHKCDSIEEVKQYVKALKNQHTVMQQLYGQTLYCRIWVEQEVNNHVTYS